MSVTIIIFKLFKIVQTKQRSLEQMLGESQQQGQVFCTVPKVRSAMLTKVHIKSSLCCKKTVPKIIWISLHENRACGLAEKDAKVKVNVWLLFTCVQNLALQHICALLSVSGVFFLSIFRIRSGSTRVADYTDPIRIRIHKTGFHVTFLHIIFTLTQSYVFEPIYVLHIFILFFC